MAVPSAGNAVVDDSDCCFPDDCEDCCCCFSIAAALLDALQLSLSCPFGGLLSVSRRRYRHQRVEDARIEPLPVGVANADASSAGAAPIGSALGVAYRVACPGLKTIIT